MTTGVFMPLVAYAEHDLPCTIESAIGAASGRIALHISVCEQVTRYADADAVGRWLPDYVLLDVRLVGDCLIGLGGARQLAEERYNGEDYQVQVDAHTRFEADWDVAAVKMLERLGPAAIVTGGQWPEPWTDADKVPAARFDRMENGIPAGNVEMVEPNGPLDSALPAGKPPVDKLAVLTSGGLDSCVLLADMARDAEVWPVYVRAGLAWEDEERRAIERFVAALDSPNVRSLVELSAPMGQIYGNHWSMTGVDVPKPGDADDAVFMPGRNIVLIGLAAVWCSTRDIGAVAIGSLGGNPFPDATPEFFEAFGAALSRGLAHEITVLAPYRGRTKVDLIRENGHLPLELSLTCMTPVGGLHCGACQKCEERMDAFPAAAVEDRTQYAMDTS